MTNGTRPHAALGFRGKNWSNTFLAQAIGVTAHTVGNYRNGKTPKDQVQFKIDNAFFGDKQAYSELRRLFRESFDIANQKAVAADGRRLRRAPAPPPTVDTVHSKFESPEKSIDTALLDEELRAIEPLIAECEQFIRWGGKVTDFDLGRFAGKLSSKLYDARERELAIVAYRQLTEDLSRSSIHDSGALERAINTSNNALQVLPAERTCGRIKLIGFDKIASSSWFGELDDRSSRLLRNAPEVLGRRIRVNSSSVDVGACAVVRLMSLRGVKIDLVTGDASGREQALTLTKSSDFDFVIAADAPMLSEAGGDLRSFVKRLDVHFEYQGVLRKRGPLGGRVPTIFVYPNSSASLHQRLLHEATPAARYRLPAYYNERHLELADYADVSERMEPGDLIFAWRPLYDRLVQNPNLVADSGSEFLLGISLFQRSDWFETALEPTATAFTNLFIAMWNKARANPLAAWLALMSSKGYLNDISRSISLR